jgi:type I restriction enzyme S subunit
MKAGWEVKTLGEVCHQITDGSHFSPKTVNSGYPYITVRDIDKDQIDFDNCKFINEIDFKQLLKNGCKPNKGDILFSKDGTVGKVALVSYERDFVVLSSLAILRPNNNQIDSNFLKYVLKSPAILDEAIGKKTGVAIRRIILRHLKDILIPVPPLPEQQRIVAILDAAFASIATAKANTEQNLKNARALFDSYLHEVFSQRGDGWEEKPISDFAHSISTGPFGSLLHKSDYVSEGVPLVNPINIVNGYIIPNCDKQINKATKQRLQSYILQEGDIVIGRRGEIGRCAVVTSEQAGWVCGTGCFFIRPLQTVNPYFLVNLIRSSKYREQLENLSSGATMLNLSNKALSELLITIPNFDEQQNILEKLDVIQEETQRLETLYQRKLTALDELKKALLHQAFNGEL